MKANHSRYRNILLVALSLIIAALACNAPVGQSSGDDVNGTLTQIAEQLTATTTADAQTPTASATPGEDEGETPTPTLAPGVTPSATECTYHSTFIDDITIPDGAEVEAGQEFTKTWRMKNNGCLAWPSGTKLVFQSGDAMNGPATVAVNPTAVGATVDITVVLTAPDTEGEHTGYWKLQTPDGLIFGERIFVKINVIPAPDTPTPTLTPTATDVTPVAKPDLVITNIAFDSDPLMVETNVTVTVTVKNDGDAQSEASVLKATFENNGTQEKNIPALAAGATHNAAFVVNYSSAGTYTLTFTADSGDSNDEQDEDNNSSDMDETFYRAKTYSTGGLTVVSSYTFDLDDGGVGDSAKADVWWHVISVNERYLEVKNGAKIGIAGTTSIGYSGCSALPKSSASLDGSPGSNQIPEGTYICVLTNEGRISQFRINAYGADLEIGYTTWYLSETD